MPKKRTFYRDRMERSSDPDDDEERSASHQRLANAKPAHTKGLANPIAEELCTRAEELYTSTLACEGHCQIPRPAGSKRGKGTVSPTLGVHWPVCTRIQ